MNLIKDQWLPVIRKNGELDVIAPWQIFEQENSVIDFDAPRADFQGALYQFCIGLLQTLAAPEDLDEWDEVREEGLDAEELREKLDAIATFFELKTEHFPAFMQDLELEEGEVKPISALLIEAPGAKTLKDNLDHFTKRGRANRLCSSCTATALFTLQINAPGGGAGHRVGLRGGGPLTTLVMPKEPDTPLWYKLWLNVLDQEAFHALPNSLNGDVFPWLASTRLSAEKNTELTPENTNPFQQYWSMPRRIKLFRAIKGDCCDLCGKGSHTFYAEYRTKNYGANYDGAWKHPLTPYNIDPKKKRLPLSLKGQQGGLNYSNWLGLTLQKDSEKNDHCAQIVEVYRRRSKLMKVGKIANLWCFGFDMDNMKARCWYEHHMPVFNLSNGLSEKQVNGLLEELTLFVESARQTSKLLAHFIEKAWFKDSQSAGKKPRRDMSKVEQSFWLTTESDFYRLIESLMAEDLSAPISGKICQQWKHILERAMYSLFDKWALSSPQQTDLERIVVARKNMKYEFYNKQSKTKEICQRAKTAAKEIDK